MAASYHTLTAEIGKHILDKLQFRSCLEKYAQRLFTTDITVKMDKVHFVSTTAQYLYKWPREGDKEYVYGHGRGHEEERTMKAGTVWNHKGHEKLEKETGNNHRSSKSPLWGKSEQRGVAWSKESSIKLGQQMLNKSGYREDRQQMHGVLQKNQHSNCPSLTQLRH